MSKMENKNKRDIRRASCAVCPTPEAPGLCGPLGSISILGGLATKARMGGGNTDSPVFCTPISRTSTSSAPGPGVSSSESTPVSRDDLTQLASAVKLQAVLALLVLVTNLLPFFPEVPLGSFSSMSGLPDAPEAPASGHLHAHGFSSMVPGHRSPGLHVSISFFQK